MIQNIVPCLIDIPRHKDARGNLSVIDDQSCLPFELKRIFYIYDIPAGTVRGGHAHYKLSQFIWSVQVLFRFLPLTLMVLNKAGCFSCLGKVY